MFQEDTYSKYVEIVKMHELIEQVQDEPLSSTFIKPASSTLEESKDKARRLINRYYSNNGKYNFADTKYYSNVELHLSLVTGYYSLLQSYKEYSYFQKLMLLPKMRSSISLLEDEIEKSISNIDNVPIIKFHNSTNRCMGTIFNVKKTNLNTSRIPKNEDLYSIKVDSDEFILYKYEEKRDSSSTTKSDTTLKNDIINPTKEAISALPPNGDESLVIPVHLRKLSVSQ